MRSISTLFLIVALSSLVFCGGCNEVHESYFERLDVAKQQHMIEKGWIPTFIPPDARDIRLVGDIDVASVYGRFVSDDFGMLRKHCSDTGDTLLDPKQMPKWFPDSLRKANSARSFKSGRYELLHCDEGNFNIAVHPSQKEVFYWSVRN